MSGERIQKIIEQAKENNDIDLLYELNTIYLLLTSIRFEWNNDDENSKKDQPAMILRPDERGVLGIYEDGDDFLDILFPEVYKILHRQQSDKIETGQGTIGRYQETLADLINEISDDGVKEAIENERKDLVELMEEDAQSDSLVAIYLGVMMRSLGQATREVYGELYR